MSKIFLSYSWNNTDLADQIDKDLTSIGIKVIRDIRDLDSYMSIRKFMKKSVAESDYIMLLISDSYLKSLNCMFEVLELFNDPNFENRIFSLIEGEARKVFKPLNRLDYVKYWELEKKKLKKKVKTVNFHRNPKILEELRIIEDVEQVIGDFCSIISDKNNVPLESLTNSSYEQILKFIGYDEIILNTEVLNILKIENKEEKEIHAEDFILKYPDSKFSFYLRGYLADEKGFNKKAEANYLKTLEIDPDYVLARINYANLQMVIFFNFEKALEGYKKALELDPQNFKAFNNLGVLYHFHLKEFQKARLSYLSAIEYNPYYSHAHHNLANLYQDHLHDFESSEEHYKKALSIEKNYSRAKHQYALLLMNHLENPEKAKTLLEEAIESTPSSAEPYKDYSQLLSSYFNDFKTARFFFDQALRLSSKDISIITAYLKFIETYYPEDLNKIKKEKGYSDAYLAKLRNDQKFEYDLKIVDL